jgi:hypothetical protein
MVGFVRVAEQKKGGPPKQRTVASQGPIEADSDRQTVLPVCTGQRNPDAEVTVYPHTSTALTAGATRETPIHAVSANAKCFIGYSSALRV